MLDMQKNESSKNKKKRIKIKKISTRDYLFFGGEDMNTLEKLQYCKNNGLSITFIAKEVGLSPATLTKWLRGEKGITHKNEKLTELTLQNIVKRLYENVGDFNDRNL